MTATHTTVTQLATAPADAMAVGSPPGTAVRAGPVTIRHRGCAPSVHPGAYVAPTAVLSGQVSVGAGSCVLHGAVLAAEGGPVQVGAGCVIMENAVLRGTVPHPPMRVPQWLGGCRAVLAHIKQFCGAHGWARVS
jgi:UDP-3-O-[3-hydroxymyristoyl] glucosamine N-acyltransferase